MEKFWIKFTCWLLMALAFQAAAAVGTRVLMGAYSLPEAAIWKKQIEFVRSAPAEGLAGEPAPLIVLGDSRPFGGIDHARLAPGSRSLALPGCTSIDAYYQLESYLRNHSAPLLIILSIAPEHWVRMDRVFLDWSLRLGSVDARQVLEVLEEKERVGGYGKPFRLDYWTDRVRIVLYRLHLFAYYRSILMSMNPVSVESGRKMYDRLDNRFPYDYGDSKTRSKNLNAEARMSRFGPDPTLLSYLKKIIDLADRRKILIAYEVMPMNEASYAKLHPRYKKDFMKFLNSIAKEAPPNTYVHTAIPHYPDELFSDPSHLNSRGAQRFTRVLQHRYAKILGALTDGKARQSAFR